MISSSLGEEYSALNNSCLKKHPIMPMGGIWASKNQVVRKQQRMERVTISQDYLRWNCRVQFMCV